MAPRDMKYRRTRWYNSLVIRTIILCVLLLICLLGSVFVITSRFYKDVVDEMRAHTEDIADDISVHLVANPDEDLDQLESLYADEFADVEISEIPDPEEEEVPLRVSVKTDPEGRLIKEAETTINIEGRRFLLLTRVALSPQTEILRLFRNEYLLALATAFIVFLGAMIYVIAKTLRPLSELSEACSAIGAGNLRPVEMRKSYGEVWALEQTFNEMVESLKEKELVETNLRQAQRLSAIGNLAAGVAHDLRNPLNAIKLLSSHTLDTLGEGAEAERVGQKLRTIREEVNRLEGIVSGFLSLAKESELRPEPRKLDLLLDEAVHLVAKDAEARGVRLTAELRAGDTELVLDPKQFTRAILNVLINAMEACPDGGRFRVFSRVTDIACEIEVRDDGPGMTPEQIERAFEPYFTTKPTGTGLGLSITRGIVEEHSGKIEIQSQPGRGTQVLITMPLHQTDSGPADPASGTSGG